MARVTAVSGLGAKGPACFLVETGQARLLLDLGYGPQPGLWPNVDGIGRVDALLLSHAHRDHAGALKLAPQVGDPPLYATASVLSALGRQGSGTSLPLCGAAEICGVTVRTGRNGHAPGGVWLHLDIGGGLLYMGDHGVESPVYAFDAPPAAATVILDASYGSYDSSLDDCARALEPVFERGLALLPVPSNGRGPELVYHLATALGTLPHLGADLRAALLRIASADEASLRAGVTEELARIAREAPPIAGCQGLMFTGYADATEGESARLVAQWEGEPRPEIVFTGYVPSGTPAQRLTDSGRARYVRWNAHPRLRDNVALARSVGARTVLPAFGDARHLDAWREAFAPAQVLVQGEAAI
ncbi:MAG: MBL fold metallo-hydrolase [Betaproteobacteria bacterium]|nr:MBL fold metallo-hydrolase [Betaproteobacteria bacterium]